RSVTHLAAFGQDPAPTQCNPRGHACAGSPQGVLGYGPNGLSARSDSRVSWDVRSGPDAVAQRCPVRAGTSSLKDAFGAGGEPRTPLGTGGNLGVRSSLAEYAGTLSIPPICFACPAPLAIIVPPASAR